MSALARLDRTGITRRSSKQTYRRTAPVEEVRADLSAIDGAQAAQERRYRVYTWLRALGWIGGIGGGILMLVTGEEALVGPVFLGGVALGFLFGFLRGAITFFEWRRIRLAQAILHELAIPPGATVGVTLDLAATTVGRKKVGKKDGFTTWRDPWLEIYAPLAGGTTLTLRRTEEVTESVQHDVGKIITHLTIQNRDVVELASPNRGLRPPPDPKRLAPKGVVVTAIGGDDARLQIGLAGGGPWGADLRAAERGVIDVPGMVQRVVSAVCQASGLPNPVLETPVPRETLGVPTFALSSLMVFAGVPVLLVAAGLGVVFGEDAIDHRRERARIDAELEAARQMGLDGADGEDAYRDLIHERPDPVPFLSTFLLGAGLIGGGFLLRRRGRARPRSAGRGEHAPTPAG